MSNPEVDPVVCCENCGGTGCISFNPNLNPNSFPSTSIVKCKRCGGTGLDTKRENPLDDLHDACLPNDMAAVKIIDLCRWVFEQHKRDEE